LLSRPANRVACPPARIAALHIASRSYLRSRKRVSRPRSGRAMSEAGVGRVLVASLHQSIADILPMRLSFYENWLSTSGLRAGTIGVAPLYAVLSFLRQEGDAYYAITARAGEYAAEWTVASLTDVRRALMRSTPQRLRRRLVLRLGLQIVQSTYRDSRA